MFFSRQVLDFFWVPGSMLSCSAFLLFFFSAFCFSCFLLFLPLCFSCFSASLLYLLLLFSASLLSLLLCFSAFVLLRLSTSTILFLFFSHVLLLFYFLLLCFSASCLYCLFVFFFSFALFSLVCILNETLRTPGETQKNLREILIRTPDKKPLHEP